MNRRFDGNYVDKTKWKTLNKSLTQRVTEDRQDECIKMFSFDTADCSLITQNSPLKKKHFAMLQWLKMYAGNAIHTWQVLDDIQSIMWWNEWMNVWERGHEHAMCTMSIDWISNNIQASCD